MRAPVVVEADPVADGAGRMLNAVETLAMDALFFDRSDHAFYHTVLLGAVGRDELLLQAVAADQGGLAVRGEDQSIVGTQQKLLGDLAQGAEPVDQGMLQGTRGCGGFAGPRQMPAQKFACVAIDHQSQRCPAIAP